MLAGLAFKRRWEKRRRDEGKVVASPNIVVSASVQVVWEKFAAYWDVEPRYVPVSKEHPNLSPEGMLEAVDDHTICVVAILGVTYTGDYEPVKELALALDDLQTRMGLDVPLHVDGASGGFIAPFLGSGARMGFPTLARALDQRVGSQVRVGLPGPRLGHLGESASTYRTS